MENWFENQKLANLPLFSKPYCLNKQWYSKEKLDPVPSVLLLRGDEGEWEPAEASSDDNEVALLFSDLGLCFGSFIWITAFQKSLKTKKNKLN